MCRHLAYLGPPVTLREMVLDPPHGLYRQSWAPRYQQPGSVNVDGFGVGWYADGDPAPARYRRGGPIWADDSFPDVARVTRTRALLAAVRDATPGNEMGADAIAPYAGDGWLFSHNGMVAGWPDSVAPLAQTLPRRALLSLPARCDSALLWTLLAHRLRAGAAPGPALAWLTGTLTDHGVTGRFNFLLTDGRMVAATAWGHSLWYRRSAGVADPPAVLVASEPGDDGPGWTRVPDRSLVAATPDRVHIRPLTTDAVPIEEFDTAAEGARGDATSEGITVP